MLLSLLYCSCTARGAGESKGRETKAVIATLDAKWHSTPILLEISEYLAEEKKEYFWNYVDRVTDIEPKFLYRGTDRDHYELLLSETLHILSQEKLSLLKFSLALRSYSPTIEMFQQIALTKNLPPGCSAVIEVNSEFTCDLIELDRLLETALQRNRSSIYKLDHHLIENQASLKSPVLVVLYGELGTEAFREFHFILQEQAKRGRFDYVIRHYIKNRVEQQVRLSGYGVELAIKSTEYKAQDDTVVKNANDDGAADTIKSENDEIDELEGFVFSRLKALYPTEVGALNKLRDHLLEETQDLAPLKVWQLKDLGMQAAQRIMSSPVDEALWVMQDIAQNFPLQSRSLIKTIVDENLSKEILKNQQIFTQHLSLSPPDAALFINGIFFDPEISDIYTILDVLREELHLIEELHRLGVKNQQMEKILSLDLSVSREDYAVDIRDSAIRYLNDLENDRVYASWLSSINDILRPTYPGMLRSIRKNIFHLVAIVDPSEPECHDILKLLESFHVHRAPLRIGLAFAVNSDSAADGFTDAGIAMLNAFNFVTEEKGSLYNGLSFLTDIYAKTEGNGKMSSSDVIEAFRAEYPREDLDLIFGLDSDYDTGRKLAWDFLQRSGLKGPPEVLINGVRLPKEKLNGDEFEEAVLSEVLHQTVVVQKAVYKNELTNVDNVLDFLMQRDNVVQRLNDRILNGSWNLIDVTGNPVINVSPEKFEKLPSSDKTASIIASLHYLTDKDDFSFCPVTVWIVTDLSSKPGRQLLLDAIQQMRSSNDLRIGIIHNPSDINDERMLSLADSIEFALQFLKQKRSRVVVEKLLKYVDDILVDKKKLLQFLDEEEEKAAYEDWLKTERSNILQIHSLLCRDVFHFENGQLGLIVNGRILGPLDKDEIFSVEDFNLLERHSLKTFGDKVRKVFEDDTGEGERDSISDWAFRVSALVLGRKNIRTRHEIKYRSADHSVLKLPPRDPDSPAFNITVIVDPVSRGAQKLSHILAVLQKVLNCQIWIFLNAESKLSDMPLKTFYRYVLDSEIKFTPDDKFTMGPLARFQKVPVKSLFTLNMDTPENWLVEVVRTPYDLDNIHLEEVDGVVYGEFELEYLLLEGHCFDQASGSPPRGLQFDLGTAQNLEIVDTIVMANLGYFQLKASPGAWFLKLRKGRSSDIYNIVSHEGTNSQPDSDDVQILIGNFRSKIIKIKVAKQPDKQHMDLLLESNVEPRGGLWNSITSTFSGSSVTKEADDDSTEDVVNIFSLASGHLYERLLRIMMLSVLKHTQTPVKFWFLKNYLSPTFKDFLPFMAKQYGFEYELVQYKWPRWLHQQTEKQRIIWGYKILFLDVLFPLHVKKIIFVDADQVVRADMKELRDLELGGAPYGYTPFCDSRKDMDGYRFWKMGYWATHLQGRKYHISALYVVDLKKFRQVAAGDRLRGQYQGLSQDRNSLSNLDQDLPNNMIHQVGIKSLPQEWLWCETWCDEAEKSRAKTIDLCNNPQTKESKLSSAMRIIPEWKGYDEEIRHLMDTFLLKKSNGTSNDEQTSRTSSSDAQKHSMGRTTHEHKEL